ncbi:histidine kinase [Parasalinivibrio latis]|uniref:histidine kinase n=1 Tax=Parasalinivibrio latis TaxID=2952610 RepID=UPI0030E1D5B7
MIGSPGYAGNYSIKLLLMGTVSVVLVLSAALCSLLILNNARDSVEEELVSAYDLVQELISPNDVSLDLAETNLNANILVDSLKTIRHIHIEFQLQQRGFPPSMPAPQGAHDQDRVPASFYEMVTPSGILAPLVIHTVNPPGRLVIYPDPIDEIEEVWKENLPIATAMFGMMVIIWLAIYFALTISLHPIKELNRAIETVREGDMDITLDENVADEIAPVTVAFNHLVNELGITLASNRVLTRKMVDHQEALRSDIARELHDEMAPCLFRIQVELMAVKNLAEKQNDTTMLAHLESLKAITEQVQFRVRKSLSQMRPMVLNDLTLKEAIQDLVLAWSAQNPEVDWDISTSLNDNIVDETARVTIYRIVQECLTNVMRHSSPTRISGHVTLDSHVENPQVHIQIINDGCPHSAFVPGLGILGMRERAEAMGGWLRFGQKSAQPNVFYVETAIPVSISTQKHFAV